MVRRSSEALRDNNIIIVWHSAGVGVGVAATDAAVKWCEVQGRPAMTMAKMKLHFVVVVVVAVYRAPRAQTINYHTHSRGRLRDASRRRARAKNPEGNKQNITHTFSHE